MEIDHLNQRVNELIWNTDSAELALWKRLGLRLIRLLYVLGRDLLEGQLTLRAMSLVYTTLLSLVPLLAISFSVLKGFGVHNQMEPFLFQFLEPLGEKGLDLGREIIGFVENVKVGVLGSVGLGMLVYTVISLLHKIELSFNFIWRVTQSRSLAQRFTEYLSVLIIGPFLIFSALGITASLLNHSLVQALVAVEPFGLLFHAASKMLPYLLVITAFTLTYVFMPNTRVHFRAAMAGGFVAGVLWQTSGWAFGLLIVSSSNYTAIYSSFAILVLFMLWLFLSWLILLFGCSIAFYTQHPEHLSQERNISRLSIRAKEEIALLILHEVILRHRDGLPGPNSRDLAQLTDLPQDAIDRVLELLLEKRLLVTTSGHSARLVPGKDPHQVDLADLIHQIRSAGETVRLRDHLLKDRKSLDGLLAAMEQSRNQPLRGISLADLVKETAASDAGDPTMETR